jgi:uncharacterized protein
MTTAQFTRVGADEILKLFESAMAHLDAAASAIDAINVYPVPDGDTGSNMSATLREAVAAGREVEDDDSAGAVIAAIAKGGLYGARGNSGVILSQALRGFSEGMKEHDIIDAKVYAEGLHRAAERAYGAVAEPKEGTMLTVLRAAGDAAMETAGSMPNGGEGEHCLEVLSAAIEAAEKAEAETIEILPALKEAGVTDSGGEGICTILRGMRAGLLGEPVPESPPDLGKPKTRVSQDGDDDDHDDGYGFCTEFLVERKDTDIDVDELRSRLHVDANKSVVVVGDARLVRVHVHTDDPDTLLDEAKQWGTLGRVKVDDMSSQAKRFRASGSGATDKLAVLALSRGVGFDEVFQSLGAMVSDLGETIKPAAGDIARTADELRVPDVIVLPNHKNVLMSANQATELASCTMHIVATETLAEGVAALVAYDPKASAKDNVTAMTEAMQSVTSVETTVAAAERTTEGVTIKEGDAIVLVDGTLIAACESQEDALFEGLRKGEADSAEIVTVYMGADARASDEELQERFSDEFSNAELEIVHGGQTLYGYVASIER